MYRAVLCPWPTFSFNLHNSARWVYSFYEWENGFIEIFLNYWKLTEDPVGKAGLRIRGQTTEGEKAGRRKSSPASEGKSETSCQLISCKPRGSGYTVPLSPICLFGLLYVWGVCVCLQVLYDSVCKLITAVRQMAARGEVGWVWRKSGQDYGKLESTRITCRGAVPTQLSLITAFRKCGWTHFWQMFSVCMCACFQRSIYLNFGGDFYPFKNIKNTMVAKQNNSRWICLVSRWGSIKFLSLWERISWLPSSLSQLLLNRQGGG